LSTYTDQTAEYDYKDLITWQNLDQGAENANKHEEILTGVDTTQILKSLGAVGTPGYSFTGDANTGMWSSAADTLSFSTAGVKGLEIDSAGIITKPLQSSFLVTAPSNTANVTGNGTIHTIEYDTEIYDQNADFNSGTYTFTAPVTGRYFLNASVIMATSTGDGQTNAVFRVVTSNRTYRVRKDQVENTLNHQHINVLADMDANDTVTCTIEISGGTQIAEVDNDATYSYFSGSLIN